MTTPSEMRRRRASVCPSRGPGLLAAAVAVALCSLPAGARAEEPTLEEIEYHPAELPPDGTGGRLMLTGAALMVGWYGVGVGTSYLWSDAPNSKDLRLPFVGPWMALGDVGCGSNESSCSTLTVVLRTTLGVLSGVGQAGGLLAFTEGVFLDTASGAAPPPNTPRSKTKRGARSERDVGFGHTWTAAPLALPDGGGIEIVGRF